jgi:hypothetical protein
MPVLPLFVGAALQSHHRGLTTVVLYLKLQGRWVDRDRREQEHQNGMVSSFSKVVVFTMQSTPEIS